MIEIIPEPKKWLKYFRNLQNDQNTPKTQKLPKYPLNLKSDQNTP